MVEGFIILGFSAYSPGTGNLLVPSHGAGEATGQAAGCRLCEQVSPARPREPELSVLPGRPVRVYTLVVCAQCHTNLPQEPREVPSQATMSFLTAQDKLACFGWPVTAELAHEMGTTVFPSLGADPHRLICDPRPQTLNPKPETLNNQSKVPVHS